MRLVAIGIGFWALGCIRWDGKRCSLLMIPPAGLFYIVSILGWYTIVQVVMDMKRGERRFRLFIAWRLGGKMGSMCDDMDGWWGM